jgi:hypothetical protein
MKDSLYHSLLRISALTLALVLLFVSGIISPVTKELANNAGDYVATAIGVNAGVVPTELNSLTAELTEKRKELAAREAAIAEREIAVNLNTTRSSDSDTATYILSAILFILLTLIILNYILDFLRNRNLTNNSHEKVE